MCLLDRIDQGCVCLLARAKTRAVCVCWLGIRPGLCVFVG